MLFTANLQNHRVSLYVWVFNQWTTLDVWVPHLQFSLCFLPLRTEPLSHTTLIGTPAQGNLHFQNHWVTPYISVSNLKGNLNWLALPTE